MAYTMTWTHVQNATMTRSDALKLEYDSPLPKILRNGLSDMKKVYEEVFVTPCGQETEEDAKRQLRKIKAEHSFVGHGWYCPGGSHEGVFEEDGRWYAYRHHAQYIWLSGSGPTGFPVGLLPFIKKLILNTKKYIIKIRWENGRIRTMQIMSNTM